MLEVRADVVVVGAGPAGVAAACAAAEAGRRVVVLDDNPTPGGQIWRRGRGAVPAAARPWMIRLAASGATIRHATTVVDAGDSGELFCCHDDAALRCHSTATILATGARELLLPFPGWTLPGVMGAGGLQALAKSGWPVAGRRVVVAGSGPLLLAVAAGLRDAGATVVALVEQASRRALARTATALVRSPAKLRQALRLARGLRGVSRLYGSWPLRAEGGSSVEALHVRTPAGDRRLPCELVACGFGLVPDTALATLLGARIGTAPSVPDPVVEVDRHQSTTVPGLFAAGEITGVGGVDVALAEGLVAGAAAAEYCAGGAGAAAPDAPRHGAVRDREIDFADTLARAFALRPEVVALSEDGTVICRCEDVVRGQLRAYDDARDAKLKTRCGMGPCQGRVCGPALRRINGWGSDRVRPPLFPVPAAVLAAIGAARDGRQAAPDCGEPAPDVSETGAAAPSSSLTLEARP